MIKHCNYSVSFLSHYTEKRLCAFIQCFSAQPLLSYWRYCSLELIEMHYSSGLLLNFPIWLLSMHRNLLLAVWLALLHLLFYWLRLPMKWMPGEGMQIQFAIDATRLAASQFGLLRFAYFSIVSGSHWNECQGRGSKLLLAAGNVPQLAASQFGSLRFAHFSIVSGSHWNEC